MTTEHKVTQDMIDDAKRYRFLRKHLFTNDCGDVELDCQCSVPNPECEELSGKALDKAIDAAIKRGDK